MILYTNGFFVCYYTFDEDLYQPTSRGVNKIFWTLIIKYN